ncbi:extracellular catalytic domain type 1 short-chain-length polyhydroxyalkanoate depolymerase [Paracoccus liaowanqingii]|nr:PHB depolymerase family esterase [Paracoccus liaowanqingii]
MSKSMFSASRGRRKKAAAPVAARMMAAFFRSALKVPALVLTPAKASKPATKAKARTAAVKAPARPRLVTAPARASFRTLTHDCAFGQRGYKIYTPASAAGSADPLPVLVMLHGCGQTPDDFAKGTRMNALAEEFRMLVVYPAQTREAHPKRCWNWFQPGDQHRGAGEPALLASLTREVLQQNPADPARVYVAGLSAGGSAALVLAQAYPDLFAGVGVHSGLPVGAAQGKAFAMTAMGQGNPGIPSPHPVPTIIFHGSKDHVVNARNGRFVALRALEPFAYLRETQQKRQVPKGRSYVRTSHRVGQGRAFVEHWLIEGSGHAWSGGSPAGRFVDPSGPDASREMVRFLLRHRTTIRKRRMQFAA